ncbi:uncharacterized protein [Mycetomoellerius zeteki]|uniref:uncharacterized protein n=1 Tax=Mycetomoellerius zeteki TaxID=64791 RepID=UPI00084E7AF6|nr:PREDICTED: uncharacterized protein LOC108724135 [Trachymyrmex zeteki]
MLSCVFALLRNRPSRVRVTLVHSDKGNQCQCALPCHVHAPERTRKQNCLYHTRSDMRSKVTVRISRRMRIGATYCPISKIERSRLFRTNQEGFLNVTLWCQRLHRGPQTAGIRVSRMNGVATGGREAYTTRIK